MCSTDSSYFRTKSGLLRLALVIMGLFTIVFGGTAMEKSAWMKINDVCPGKNCPPRWSAEVGISFVVLAWLYSLVMLVGLVVLKMAPGNRFKQMDSIGHYISGCGLFAAFGLYIGYVSMTLRMTCEENDGDASPYPDFDIEYMKLLTSTCKLVELNKGEIFQPILFGVAGIFALVSGILAHIFAQLTRQSANSPLPYGVDG